MKEMTTKMLNVGAFPLDVPEHQPPGEVNGEAHVQRFAQRFWLCECGMQNQPAKVVRFLLFMISLLLFEMFVSICVFWISNIASMPPTTRLSG